jgi:Holliday junction resolvase RusA-like endonuclease
MPVKADQIKNFQILEPDTRFKKVRPDKKAEIALRLELERLQEKVKLRATPVQSNLTKKQGIGNVKQRNLSKNDERLSKLGPKQYVFIIEPNTKPRQTRSDKWKQRPCVMQYRRFADTLRDQAREMSFELQDTLNIEFIVPMPDSWNKAKKQAMNMKPHQQTPDIDNYCKAFLDAMEKQDKRVWKIEASKRWGIGGAIIVRD